MILFIVSLLRCYKYHLFSEPEGGRRIENNLVIFKMFGEHNHLVLDTFNEDMVYFIR